MRAIEAVIVAVLAVLALVVAVILAVLPYAFATVVVVETLRLLGVLG